MDKNNEQGFWFNVTCISNGWMMKYECFSSDGFPHHARERYFATFTECIIFMKQHIDNAGVENE